MVVDYTKYMKPLREKYIAQKTILVQLPPGKAPCPDCTVTDSALSLINSPPDYCITCNNRGFIETAVQVSLRGSVADFMGDSQSYPGMLVQDSFSNFDTQIYIIHATSSDCTTNLYPGENCFKFSKEVIIENEHYKILSIDNSTLLGQTRVVISKTN